MSVSQQQLVGESAAFHALMDQVSDSAALNRSMLVIGERGTGKDLIASRLHFLSPRWEQVYTTVNCAAYTDQLLDEALFGLTYFDGRADIDGHFSRADNGTLMLDNIDHVSLRLQEKLLQSLEHGIIDPLGSPDTEEVDVRVIAASTRDLNVMLKEGAFRADLLDRLAFDVLTLPPLRQRQDDIAPLAEHFGRKVAAELGADSFAGFTPEAIETLMQQSWPGNIRALKTTVERTVAQSFLRDETLSAPITSISLDPFGGPWRLTEGDVPTETILSSAPEHIIEDVLAPEADFSERVFKFERGLIDEALTVAKNHQGKAADHLGLTYHQFRGLLRKHGLKK